MKIAVMGSGSIGGSFGARMAAAGAEVMFIARGAHLAAIRAHGLTVRSPLGDLQIAPATATDDPAAVGKVDVVLLATKLYDVEAAAQALGPMIGRDTAIVCLQNGIDAPDIVERAPQQDAHAVGGVVMINAEVAAPGVIRHNALNRLTLGELDGRASAQLGRLVTLGNRAGIETDREPRHPPRDLAEVPGPGADGGPERDDPRGARPHPRARGDLAPGRAGHARGRRGRECAGGRAHRGGRAADARVRPGACRRRGERRWRSTWSEAGGSRSTGSRARCSGWGRRRESTRRSTGSPSRS